jgi:RNA polymerase sigma factor (sigma-70 family)
MGCLSNEWMDIVRERVIQHIKLAQILAAKYFNIPGASREEILSEAQTALVKASMAYQEDKGPFTAFAGTVIRNALNSLFNKQLRQVKMIGKSLDETIHGATQYGTHIGNLGQNIADSRANTFLEVKNAERKSIILKSINSLNIKEKKIVSYIANGMSLSEISEKVGVSKQAIFKTWQNAKRKIKILLNEKYL